MKKLMIIFATCLAAHVVYGDEPVLLFLTEPVDARSVAMGEANVAAVSDAAALFWNPAAFARQEAGSAHFSNGVMPDGISQQLASVGGSWNHWGWGLGALRFDAGSVTRRDIQGRDQGELEPVDAFYGGSIARDFAWGAAGLTLKYVRSQLDDSVTAWAADVGVLSPDWINGKFRAAATLSNIGSDVSYDSVEEPLPTTLKVGGQWQWNRALVSTLDVNMPFHQDVWAGAGLEWAVSTGASSRVLFRGGVNSRSEVGVFGGMGFKIKSFTLDYAISPVRDLGVVHRASLGFKL